jgi:hypothetical protein
MVDVPARAGTWRLVFSASLIPPRCTGCKRDTRHLFSFPQMQEFLAEQPIRTSLVSSANVADPTLATTRLRMRRRKAIPKPAVTGSPITLKIAKYVPAGTPTCSGMKRKAMPITLIEASMRKGNNCGAASSSAFNN